MPFRIFYQAGIMRFKFYVVRHGGRKIIHGRGLVKRRGGLLSGVLNGVSLGWILSSLFVINQARFRSYPYPENRE